METPQELEVWYIIPAIRRELALSMKNNGMKQVEIADKLGVTKSAITQYINHSRASQINFSEKIKAMINDAVNSINNKMDTMREIQKILVLARNESLVCQVHRSMDKDFENCNVCFEKNLVSIEK